MVAMKGAPVQQRTTLIGTDRRARLITLLLVNSMLAVALAALYLALVTALPRLLGAAEMGVAHALATIAVAVSLIPLRRRILALVNRLMHQEWQRSQDLLREIGASLSRSIDAASLHAVLIDDLPKRLGVQRAVLWILEPPDDHAFVPIGGAGPGDHTTLLANGAGVRRISQAEEYIETTPESTAEWAQPFIDQQLQIVIPLRVGERLVGIYGCGPARDGATFPPLILDILLTLAPALASAVENARAYTNIARLNAELQTLDQMKDDFIESVGHELRTPLTTLSLSAQLLMNQPQTPPSLVRMTRTGIAQLQALIDRILAFEDQMSQPGARKRIGHTMINVDSLLNDLLTHYEPMIQTKGLRMSAYAQPGLVIWGTPPWLRRALHEVVDNAVRYSNSGDISVTATFEDGLALFRVSDQGPGIPEEEQSRLFKAFYRGRDVRALAETPGVGLGLSIAQRDIELLGGRIWLEQSGPDGSVVCVALPAELLPEDGTLERSVGAN
jgi:signal transduction histidine kinase